jgi:hypothetical protein
MIPTLLLFQTGSGFDKDTMVAIGVIITAILGFLNLGYNLRHNRRASYVSAVTATRLKWIDELRSNLSRLVALIYQCTVARPAETEERQKIFQEIAHLRMLIRLQLAPGAADDDKAFETQLESLFQEIDSLDSRTIEAKLNDLVAAGQAFLWKEWRKAKKEAILGDPYDTLSYRLKAWSDRIDAQTDSSADSAKS